MKLEVLAQQTKAWFEREEFWELLSLTRTKYEYSVIIY